MSPFKLAVPAIGVTAILSTWGGVAISDYLPAPKTVTQYIQVEKPEEKYPDLIREIAPKYGVPLEVVAVLIQKEHDDTRYPYRFEPGQMARAQRLVKNESQARLAASSYCPLQVMGWHAVEKGDHPLDLLKPRVCVEYGVSIIAKCLDRWRGKPASERYQKAFECYNGGAAYGKDAYTKLQDILLTRLG